MLTTTLIICYLHRDIFSRMRASAKHRLMEPMLSDAVVFALVFIFASTVRYTRQSNGGCCATCIQYDVIELYRWIGRALLSIPVRLTVVYIVEPITKTRVKKNRFRNQTACKQA